jgi:hypothetical protein
MTCTTIGLLLVFHCVRFLFTESISFSQVLEEMRAKDKRAKELNDARLVKVFGRHGSLPSCGWLTLSTPLLRLADTHHSPPAIGWHWALPSCDWLTPITRLLRLADTEHSPPAIGWHRSLASCDWLTLITPLLRLADTDHSPPASG